MNSCFAFPDIYDNCFVTTIVIFIIILVVLELKMSAKKASVTVRPEPPTFSEISEDIIGADDDDVIFAGAEVIK